MPSVNFDLSDIKPLLSTLGLGQAPSPPAPINNRTIQPLQLPPTPAAAGFTEWAGDMKNAQKVTSGLTLPGQPLLPPTQPPLGSNVPLNPSASGNIMPPQRAPMAFLNPPGASSSSQPSLGPLSTSLSPSQNSSLFSAAGDDKSGTATQRAFPSPVTAASGLHDKMVAAKATAPRPLSPTPGPFLVPPAGNPNPFNPSTPPPAMPQLPQAASGQFNLTDPLAGVKPLPSYASAQPPATPTMAAVQPPKSDTSFLNPPGMTSAPSHPPSQSPNVSPQSLQTWQQQNPDQVAKPQLVGQGWKGFLRYGIPAALVSAGSGLSNMGHGDPTAGIKLIGDQVAQDRSAPEINQSRYNAAVIQPIQNGLALQKSQADLEHTRAETTDIGNKSQLQLAKYGLKTETDPTTGITSTVPDPDSPVFRANQDKDAKLQHQTELIGAQIDNTKAQKELRDAQTAFNQAKTDPNSPLFKQVSQRLATAQQNAGAAALRAKAYMGNYMQHAYNTGLDGQVLPGASVISDDNGNQSVVGSTNASLAAKNQSNAAQFNDVHGALDSVEQAASNLVQGGGRLNSPGVAAALAQPRGTLEQWLQGAGVKANLSPTERAYVQAIAAAHENVQALRKSAGGTATDSAVSKLDALIPNASTPDLNYLFGQTNQIRQTAERLGKGATVATGGLSVRGQGNKSAITVTAPDGSIHPFKSQAAAAKFKTLAGIK